jgi:hypothetical protein
MAYNGRTGNYTGAYPAGYGYQTPYWPQVQQPMMVQQEPNTRTVEVESADSIRAAQETQVGAGQTKMFIGKDDSFILVKAVSMTGQVAMDIYDKRPPEPPVPVLNPEEFVRKDELSTLIAEIVGQQKRTTAKKEAAE